MPDHFPLPLPARVVQWKRSWDRLLQPPRTEPAAPEQIPTPESVNEPNEHSRGESGR
jgi:hypothetical protein